MKIAVTEELRQEATRFSLRFACDDCAHFDPGRQRCSLGYPASPRHDALLGNDLELCKSFEVT